MASNKLTGTNSIYKESDVLNKHKDNFNQKIANSFEEQLNVHVKKWSIEKCDETAKKIMKMKQVGDRRIFLEAEAGNISEIRELLKVIDVNSEDYDGNSVLHFAARSGSVELVKYLIENEAKIDCRNDQLDSPLHFAAICGHADLLQIFLDNICIDIQNVAKNTALHLAAANGHAEIVKILLKQNAKINLKNNEEKTPYFIAKNEDVILEFLGEKSVVSDLEYKNHLLFESIKNNWKIMFRKLIELKVDPNIKLQDRFLHNPVIYASMFGRAAMLKILIDNKGDIFYKNNYNNTAVHLAAINGQAQCLKLLLQFNANVDEPGYNKRTPLLAAAWYGKNKIIRILLEHNANILHVDESSWNVLHCACDKGYEITIKLLLDQGAELEKRDINGNTPLSIASLRGQKQAVQVLIDLGANVNSKNDVLDTPLHIACIKNHMVIAKLLLKHGANINAINKANKTALNCAEDKAHRRIIKVFKYHIT